MALARLERKVTMLGSRLGTAAGQERKPWMKSQLTPKRVTGRALQARNARIKLRDQYTCQACKRITTELEVDHRIPVSRGGSDDDSNLQCLCAGKGLCHEQKTIRERTE